MGCPAEAEEAVRIGVGVEVQRLDLADAGGDQAVDDISFKVEVRLARRAFREEAGIVRIGAEETRSESLVDLVGRPGDAGTDRRVDALAASAELLHRVDCRVGDSGECASPAGVGGADDACLVHPRTAPAHNRR